MNAIVLIALKRPYTFVVLAILILIFGGRAVLRTPTDIFPNIGIPVVAVVWSYNGLTPEDMSGRVVYYYERELTTTVNNIEHIESQSLYGRGIIKMFSILARTYQRRRPRSLRSRELCCSCQGGSRHRLCWRTTPPPWRCSPCRSLLTR
jgi:Cu/Ag efflux pump CusA